MSQRLIIIRGNSGSGKSTVAKKLQLKLGDKTMLVPQDVVRREILHIPDGAGNDSIQLIYDMAMYGSNHGYDVIIEGIFRKKKYGEMLTKLINDFNGVASVYYFDVTFDETLRRHLLKPNRDEFGQVEMSDWWEDADYMNMHGEKFITDAMSEDEAVQMMYSDLSGDMTDDLG